MKLPNLLGKWTSRKASGPKGAGPGVVFKFVILSGLVLMLMVIVLAPQGPSRDCYCPDRDRQRPEQARRDEKAAVRQRARDSAAQRKREAVRREAAERVRRALEEWEREQAEREAAVRAAIRSREELDAAGEPAAEVAPR